MRRTRILALIFIALIPLLSTIARAEDRLSVLKSVASTGLLANAVAKNLATCHFVNGMTFDYCLDTFQLPIPPKVILGLLEVYYNESTKTVVARPGPAYLALFALGRRPNGNDAVARCVDSLYGCELIAGAVERSCDKSQWNKLGSVHPSAPGCP